MQEAYINLTPIEFSSTLNTANNVNSFLLKYDASRRCFKLCPKNKISSVESLLFKHNKNHYIEEIKGDLFKRDYILLEAAALKDLISTGAIRNNGAFSENDPDWDEDLEKLIQMEDEEFEDIKRTFGQASKTNSRIWKDEEGNYVTLLDGKSTYISTADGNISAFQQIISGKGYLRRSNSFFSVFKGKKFTAVSEERKIEQIEENPKHKNEMGEIIQNLLVFPATLALIKVGIEDLIGENKHNFPGINGLLDFINDCQLEFNEFMKMRHYLAGDVKKCLDVIDRLNKRLQALEAPLDTGNSKALKSMVKIGHDPTNPAMVSTFGAVATHVLTSFLEQNKVLSNVKSPKFRNPLYNKDNPTIRFEVLKNTSKSCELLWETLMKSFDTEKADLTKRNISRITHSKKDIDNSNALSNFAKKTILASKAKPKIPLSLGEDFESSAIKPAFYIGLGLALGEVSNNLVSNIDPTVSPPSNLPLGKMTASVIRHYDTSLAIFMMQKISGIKKPLSLPSPDPTISKYENLRILHLANEKIRRLGPDTKNEIGILNEKGYALELLTYFNTVVLSVNKIIRESEQYMNSSNEPISQAIEKNILPHYKGKKHKRHLLQFIEFLSPENSDHLTSFINTCNSDMDYMGMWGGYISALKVQEEDIQYITELASFLNKYVNFPHERSWILTQVPNLNIPSVFKEAIIKNTDDSYEKMIVSLQNAYMSYKILPLTKMTDSFQNISSGVLSRELLNSTTAKNFEASLMEDQYRSERFYYKKQQSTQNEDNSFYISGKVQKRGENKSFYRLSQKSRLKNVYLFNEDALLKLKPENNEFGYTPKTEIFHDWFTGTNTKQIESEYKAPIHALKEVVSNDFVALEKYTKRLRQR
jgi:hypothetical protein